jgi:RimJ/RimL family protein N-acetyltransferase
MEDPTGRSDLAPDGDDVLMMINATGTVPGDGVRLRLFRPDDVDDVATGCNDRQTLRFLALLPDPYTREDALWWIEQGAPAAITAGGAAYCIADPQTDRVLGGIGLRVRNPVTAEAEVGYWVVPWARRRGVATAAVGALTQYAFDAGLARMELRTDWENAASQRVALAAGFVREGERRGSGRMRDGTRYDQICWARLADDPPGPSPRLLPDLPAGALSDGVVSLRPLGPADLEPTFALRCLPDVVATSVPAVRPERSRIVRLCARSAALWLAGDTANFAIRDAESDEYAGEIALYYLEPPTGQAMVGYSMLPAWRGRGYATRAVNLVATWAFEQVGVARLIAGTAPENVGSQRVLERAGFAREGYQLARLPGPDGTRIDDVLYARLPGQPHQNTDAMIA